LYEVSQEKYNMDYNFDELIDRQNTDSIKYDLREAIFGREDVLPMWVADMDFRTPDFILEDLQKRLKHEILGYTLEPSGLREAIADWMSERHDWKIRREWIVTSPGVVPTLAIILYAFSEPNDEIIVQQPVYFPFFRTITNNGRILINNPLTLRNGRYEMNLQDLTDKITEKTKMIFLCSPHNPGGRVWRRKELEEFSAICLEKDVLIISDEIHADLVLFGNKHTPTATLGKEIANRTITCMSSSKTFNTAGLSTSYVIISNSKMRGRYKDKLHDFHLDIGNIAGLVALESAYRKGATWLDQLLRYIEGNIEFLQDYIHTYMPDIKVMKPEGTYLVWLDFRKTSIDNKNLKNFLIREAGLGLSDGALFGQEGVGFQRLNVACPRSIIVKGLDNLKNAYYKLKFDETQ
jgi:cystathionine beta-lyase